MSLALANLWRFPPSMARGWRSLRRAAAFGADEDLIEEDRDATDDLAETEVGEDEEPPEPVLPERRSAWR